MIVRYTIEKRLGINVIVDNVEKQVHAFGYNIVLPESDVHRRQYNNADARAICDWLNSISLTPAYFPPPPV